MYRIAILRMLLTRRLIVSFTLSNFTNERFINPSAHDVIMPSGDKKVAIDVKGVNAYLVFVQQECDKSTEVIHLLSISNKVKDFLLIQFSLIKDQVYAAQLLLLP